MPLWRRFVDGNPEYLARHYWFAYLWPRSARFFDHPFIINAILFGHYLPLVREALRQLRPYRDGRCLQLSCVYGRLTVMLARRCRELHLADVADLQLNIARTKTKNMAPGMIPARMNAERTAYADDSFSTVLIFFLLHELPSDARERVLSEAARVARPGGRIVVAEYAQHPTAHPIWRIIPLRKLLATLEPFLLSYWNGDVAAELSRLGARWDKHIVCRRITPHFNGFYSVHTFDVLKAPIDD